MQDKLEKQLMAEVIYHRFSEQVRVADLAVLEHELADALADRLGGTDTARADAAAIVRKHFNRAWKRAEAEYNRLRADPTAVFFDANCPVCVTMRSTPS